MKATIRESLVLTAATTIAGLCILAALILRGIV